MSSAYRLNRRWRVALYSLILLNMTPAVQSDDGTLLVTVALNTAFNQQRACGRGCLQNPGNDVAALDVSRQFDCASNACYCGTQIQTEITPFLTSCWSYACNPIGATPSLVSPDVSTALSIYDNYCSTAYQQALASSVTSAAVTIATTLPGSTALPPTPSSTTTPTGGADSPSGGRYAGLSKGTIAGIAVGIVIVLAALLIPFFFLHLHSRRRNNTHSLQAGDHQTPLSQKSELAAPSNDAARLGNRQAAWPEVLDQTSKTGAHSTPIETPEMTGSSTFNSMRITSPAELDYNPYIAELAADKPVK